MSDKLAVRPADEQAQLVERVVIQGDLSRLSATERANYYGKVCASLGLNPLTRPFEYLKLNGREILYARRDCTDQLRQIHAVTVTIAQRERVEDVYVVTARATLPSGRADESTGAVPLGNLKGEALANALMKAETKAKRRVTLSICGLSVLDETELETIPEQERRQQISPHIEAHETGDELPAEDSPFDSFMSAMLAHEATIDAMLVPGANPSYDAVLTARAWLGSKAKQSELTKALQVATESGRLVPDERKALSKNWMRMDRKVAKLEANVKTPDAVASFSDPDDADEQGYVPRGEREPGED